MPIMSQALAAIALTAVVLLFSSAIPGASAQCPGSWSSWSVQECNCTDDTYWSVRECTSENGTGKYLHSLELDIANCSSQCRAAQTDVCKCNLMVQSNNGSWKCQDYECFLYGYNKTTWSAWTPVTDCGPSYRSREWSCTWIANTSALNGIATLLNSTTCGERCIGCITADPPRNCTDACGDCANTTFSLVMQDCSSMYSIEIENVTCGSWGGWVSLGSCRLLSSCPNSDIPMLKRTRTCNIAEADRIASSNACPDSTLSQFECSVCNSNSSSSVKSPLKPSAADPTFQVVAPAKASDLPALLPSIEKRQVSKPKVEAKQAVAVGSSMCLVFVGFIIFIVAIDAHSIAEEAVNRMGKNLKKACTRKPSSKRH